MSPTPDVLERFRRGPELLAVVLTGVFGEEEDFEAAPGKWTIRQIAAHLADSEVVAAHRIRQELAEENPQLIAVDQDAWASGLGYARRKVKQSLETFRRLRAENHDLLKDTLASACERRGIHSQDGPLTLQQLVERHAVHVESHARQIQAIRDAYRKAKGKA